MRVCLVSRRYWPAVSGMSVYAEHLPRNLVALGVDGLLVSQYRDDEAGTRVYGGGPPVRVPTGVRAVGVPSRREAVDPADFEGDTDELERCVIHRAAITQVLDRSTAVLIGSPSFRDEVVGHHGTDPDRFQIVPGATDTVRYTPEPMGRPSTRCAAAPPTASS